MKTNILVLLCVCILGYGVTQWFYSSSPPAPEPAVDFAFTDIAGKEHRLSDFEGKVVLLNFWASWCAPCLKEFPHLLELTASNRDKIVLLALSSDFKEEDIRKFLGRQKGWQAENVIIALDQNGAASELYGITGLPETFVIGPNRAIAHKLVGAEWDVKDVQKKIDFLLPR